MPGLLNHSAARVIHALLVDRGYGASSGQWTTKTGGEADSPDDVITCYHVAGRDDGSVMFGERQQWHGVQVRVRSNNPETGFRKANSIKIYLDEVVNAALVTIDDTQYNVGSVNATGDVTPLGRDEPNSNRWLFTTDFLVSVTQLPTK